MKIVSAARVVGRLQKDFSQQRVKDEPMLWNCNRDTAWRHGGEITQAFLSALPDDWRDGPLVIDSRVHMLMPGWYPCIPGWHHDDVPRTREDGQPNYGPGQLRSEHIMMLVNADICATEFALGEADFDVPPLGQVIYEQWHRDVSTLVKNQVLETMTAKTCELIEFDDRAWHRGVPAVAAGWRFFIRASRHFSAGRVRVDRPDRRANEIRQQVQVYLEQPNKGW